MSYRLLLIFFLIAALAGHAQLNLGYVQIDSLKRELSLAKADSTRVLLMSNLCEGYRWSKPDSALYFGQQALTLSRDIKFLRGEANALVSLSVIQRELGNLPKSLDLALKGLQIAEVNGYDLEEINALVRVANAYAFNMNLEKAASYLRICEVKAVKMNHPFSIHVAQWLLADTYRQIGKLDSALQYAQKARMIPNQSLSAFTYNIYGDILLGLNRDEEALASFHTGLVIAGTSRDYRTSANLNRSLANYYKRRNMADSAIYYAKQGLATAQILSYKNRIMSSSALLAELYESRDPKEAIKYHKIYSAARDSLYSFEKMQAMENIAFDERERQHEVEAAKTAYRNRIKLYILIGGLALFLLIILLLARNNKLKQRANKILHRQKQEIDRQKEKLQESLDHLKTTQAQLIQSEKMASLGEMTAGIAHEIQNPLNFVNNFSEVNLELIEEIDTEIGKGNLSEIIALAQNLRENQQKINQHGKRADAIVKSMLQHTRSGTGVKEPTDINALADEYFRLAYHGLRAKDKSFNATIKTDFDPAVGQVPVVPQDMGRVILNLITNAFYAVNEKKQKMSSTPPSPKGVNYEPMVTVKTKKIVSPSGDGGNKVELRVIDNGGGIPQKVIDKIFQPFFTTKQTGDGTGLGLSLSYDIVKAHGGELKVENKEGEGATFVVIIPSV